MFIETEETPNPATLKFRPGVPVMGARPPRDFADGQAAGASPLAERLFEIQGVGGVLLGADCLSGTKQAERDWDSLKPAILGTIMEHFTAGRPILAPAGAEGAGAEADGLPEAPVREEDREIVDQIKELLDHRVRPAVAMDGGDIVFGGYDQGTVFLHMRGACSGCPSSTATLKAGIENLLAHYIPEVREVQAL